MIRIYHYRDKCIGCNACVEVNKDRWRVSRKDGKSTLIAGVNIKGVFRCEVDDDEHVNNKRAEKNCPVKIIRIEKLK